MVFMERVINTFLKAAEVLDKSDKIINNSLREWLGMTAIKNGKYRS
jgi:hypothetical protein